MNKITINLTDQQISIAKEKQKIDKKFNKQWELINLEIKKASDKVVREIFDDFKKSTKKRLNFNLCLTKGELIIKTLSHPNNTTLQLFQVDYCKRGKQDQKMGTYRIVNEGEKILVERLG